ncbi:MAG: hypothetical protein PHC28_15220 [Flavobacterium sp.]|uniref:hypothetical protein n=1 Tax=Flavobacterium sp. TaxID=239 RepID=UPI00260298A4|nr:hypothetical protein [Flavobacterium sp.]MDD5151805.1 hypothetical protein [Flavobacterium sp.]
MSFSNLRKNSLSNLVDKINKEDQKGSYQVDERLWQPAVDKAGNGYAVIRFLPQVDGEDLPYIVKYQHSFKSGSKWFIENCPSTINEKCPVCENNGERWATELESEKAIAREHKRNKSYFSNILVISDKDRPENEGKVFIFRYGQKIFDKIKSAMNPEFADDVAYNPFDFWAGANFRIKIKQVAGFRNYDDSAFGPVTSLFDGDDEKLEQLWKLEYPLLPLISPSEFKSYDELKTKFYQVTGSVASVQEEQQYKPQKAEISKPVFNQKVESTNDDFSEEDYEALLNSMED